MAGWSADYEVTMGETWSKTSRQGGKELRIVVISKCWAHADVLIWKHLLRYRPFVWGFNRNVKCRHYWHLGWNSTSDRMISIAKGQCKNVSRRFPHHNKWFVSILTNEPWFRSGELSTEHIKIYVQESGGRLNKKDGLTRYGDSHVKDKTS